MKLFFSIQILPFFKIQAVFAAPKKATEKTQLEQLAEQVQAVANEFSATLQKNLPDSKDVTKTITTQSQQFAQNVENIVKKLETEVKYSILTKLDTKTNLSLFHFLD